MAVTNDVKNSKVIDNELSHHESHEDGGLVWGDSPLYAQGSTIKVKTVSSKKIVISVRGSTQTWLDTQKHFL